MAAVHSPATAPGPTATCGRHPPRHRSGDLRQLALRRPVGSATGHSFSSRCTHAQPSPCRMQATASRSTSGGAGKRGHGNSRCTGVRAIGLPPQWLDVGKDANFEHLSNVSVHVQGRNKADKELEAIAKAEVRPIDGWDIDMDSCKCSCCCLRPAPHCCLCAHCILCCSDAGESEVLHPAADGSLIKELPHSIHKVDAKGNGGRAEGDFWCVYACLHKLVVFHPASIQSSNPLLAASPDHDEAEMLHAISGTTARWGWMLRWRTVSIDCAPQSLG